MILPADYLADPAYMKMEKVFNDFVLQGAGRRVQWVSEVTGLPLSVVTRGMVKGHWLQRIEEIGREAEKLARSRIVNDVSALNEFDVGTLTEVIDLAKDKLMKALEDDRVPPATLAKLVPQMIEMRRKMLGLDDGGEGDLATRMGKMLKEMNAQDNAKPFVLDPKRLTAPEDLPTMPGMTSDALMDLAAGEEPEENQRGRELTDDEKEMLGG